MSLLRRRIMMANQNNEERFLKHWWSGKDALVNGYLVDRCCTGVNWKMNGNPLWDGTQYIFDSTAKYAKAPIRKFDFGHHFKVYLDGEINASIYLNTGTVLDIGSVTNANKNIGFFCYQGFAVNWKMQGNNSNPGINYKKDTNYPKDDTYLYFNDTTDWIPIKCSWSILDRGNGYDRCVVQNYNSIFEYSVDVPKVGYNDFSKMYEYALLSRGVVTNYGIGLKLKELKIYVYD